MQPEKPCAISPFSMAHQWRKPPPKRSAPPLAGALVKKDNGAAAIYPPFSNGAPMAQRGTGSASLPLARRAARAEQKEGAKAETYPTASPSQYSEKELGPRIKTAAEN
jgi:hypothetical protein